MILKDYITETLPGEGKWICGNKSWSLSTLLKASESLEEFDLHLMSLDIDKYPWKFSDWNFNTFLYHCNRMDNTDLKYPVLLTPDGYICDGWHRLAKAILKGKKTIKAKRFKIMPEEDDIINESSENK